MELPADFLSLRRGLSPRRAYDSLRPMFMTCLGSVSWPGL